MIRGSKTGHQQNQHGNDQLVKRLGDKTTTPHPLVEYWADKQ